MLFDLLALDDLDLREVPLAKRRESLVGLLEDVSPPLRLTPATTDFEVAEEWFGRFDGGGFDGVMAKKLDGVYLEDKRAQVKVKHHRSVDCVVAGYAEHKNGGVGSLKLGLRGVGEKQIETDRRIIRDRIAKLKVQLTKIDKQMIVQRKNRGKMVRVALVGYTNAGKSTLMRILVTIMQASSGEVHSCMKLPACLRVARYSGR